LSIGVFTSASRERERPESERKKDDRQVDDGDEAHSRSNDIRVCSQRSDDGYNFGKAENMVEGAYIGVERVIRPGSLCDKSDI
jgi:hypothetical protein